MSRIVGVIALLVLGGSGYADGEAPDSQPPDLSGRWTLDEGLVVGATRSSAAAPSTTGQAGGTPTSVNTISGAAFNCGRECRITQTGNALTVAEAVLADYAGKDSTRQTPPVTLTFDGNERTVVDTFNPHLDLSVTAGWQEDGLHIQSRRGRTSKQQVVSLDGNRLVVVNVALLNGTPRSTVTLRYARR